MLSDTPFRVFLNGVPQKDFLLTFFFFNAGFFLSKLFQEKQINLF